MSGAFVAHVWQSTLFVLVIKALTVGLREDRANVRYWLWFAASIKFLLPFSLLINLGTHLTPAPMVSRIAPQLAAMVLTGTTLPASAVSSLATGAPQTSFDWIHITLFGLWLCGAVAIGSRRIQAWRHIRAIVDESTTSEIPGFVSAHAGVRIRSSISLLEPSVVGVFHPVLLLPSGIEEYLAPGQLRAVLAHELWHARRRDNLTATIHMLVEALFWFNPCVWWIGARLVDERERACDEHVLQVLREPQTYAEGILKVCKQYLESPLPSVSAVTGSANIKKRIEDIMNDRIGRKLNFSGKAMIVTAAVAAVCGPIFIGMLSRPLRAQSTDVICAESDPAIRAELQAADDKILNVDGAEANQTAAKLAQELVDDYPNDFIVHIRYQQWMRGAMGSTALIERYQSLAAAHPGDPVFTVLYAQALRGTDNPRAIQVLQGVPSSPLNAWVHLTLAELYSWSKPQDLAQARSHLDAWFGACPAVPNWSALGTLVAYGSAETAAKEAAVLRGELENETDPHLLLSWQFVWALELKGRPVDERAAVRQQIALDVARLESIPAPKDNRWPELLTMGHNLASDSKGP
jgi:beta-lactamase regulating signal transducer with metallopeptidase domain